MSSNSLLIKSPVDKNDQCVRQFFFSLNIKLATWQQMCDSVSSYSIYTRRRIFFGKITAVVLNKTCDSLKAIKSSVQSETVVYYCATVKSRYCHGFAGSVHLSGEHVTQIDGDTVRNYGTTGRYICKQ